MVAQLYKNRPGLSCLGNVGVPGTEFALVTQGTPHTTLNPCALPVIDV
jgi:hypothetical protein